jgi:hypothetical protein
MSTNMYAFEILCRIKAGLQLCGQNEDGELEWLGTNIAWQDAMKRELNYLFR